METYICIIQALKCRDTIYRHSLFPTGLEARLLYGFMSAKNYITGNNLRKNIDRDFSIVISSIGLPACQLFQRNLTNSYFAKRTAIMNSPLYFRPPAY